MRLRILTLLTCTTLLSVSTGFAESISFDPASASVGQGDAVNVTVRANFANQSVSSFTARIVLGANVTIVGGASGVQVGSAWNLPIALLAGNQLDIAGAIIGGGTTSGEVVLANFTVNATSAGEGALQFDANESYALTPANVRVNFTSYGSASYQFGSSTNISLVFDKSMVAVPEGGTATFGVKLGTQPGTDKTVTLSRASGDADITVQSNAKNRVLTFTSANWNTFQNVTLAAAQDADTANGAATIQGTGTGLTSASLTATEVDDDLSGIPIEFNKSTLDVSEGDTATFKVRLGSQPTSNKTVTISRTSGDSDISIQSGASRTFTPANWDVYQTVTLEAEQDADATNGSAVIQGAGSGLTSASLTATEVDDDSLNVLFDKTSLGVPEGGSASFKVKLGAQPPSNLSVTVSRASGDTDITVSNNAKDRVLTFTTANWNNYQTVTLDAAVDADSTEGTAIIQGTAAGAIAANLTATEVEPGEWKSLDVGVDVIYGNCWERDGRIEFQIENAARPGVCRLILSIVDLKDDALVVGNWGGSNNVSVDDNGNVSIISGIHQIITSSDFYDTGTGEFVTSEFPTSAVLGSIDLLLDSDASDFGGIQIARIEYKGDGTPKNPTIAGEMFEYNVAPPNEDCSKGCLEYAASPCGPGACIVDYYYDGELQKKSGNAVSADSGRVVPEGETAGALSLLLGPEVSKIWRIEPASAFSDPYHVSVSVPESMAGKTVRVVYFVEDVGKWYFGDQVEGWLASDPVIVVDEEGGVTAEFDVTFGGVFQIVEDVPQAQEASILGMPGDTASGHELLRWILAGCILLGGITGTGFARIRRQKSVHE